MNKKLLMLTLIPLVLSVIVSPTMAIGPQKAKNNPHITHPPEGGVELLTPSGVDHSWVANTEIGVMDFEHILDASKAKIRNAMPLTLAELQQMMLYPEIALQYENKWGYMSNAVLGEFFEWLMNIGYPITPEEIALILSMYPEGIYIMFVNVGK
jgi:hypothetical protein